MTRRERGFQYEFGSGAGELRITAKDVDTDEANISYFQTLLEINRHREQYVDGLIRDGSMINDITLTHEVRHSRDRSKDVEHNLYTWKRRLEGHLAKIKRYEENPPKSYSLAQIKEILYTNKHILPGSIVGSKHDGGRITFVLRDLMLRMDSSENRYTKINNGGEVIVPVPDVAVRYTIGNNGFRFSVYRSSTSLGVIGPHVYPDGRPCFGSFSVPIATASAEGDLNTVVTLLVMYLTAADPGDDLGKKWHRFVYQHATQEGKFYQGYDKAYGLFHIEPDGKVYRIINSQKRNVDRGHYGDGQFRERDKYQGTNWPTEVFADMVKKGTRVRKMSSFG